MSSIEAVLGTDGPLARTLPGFTARPSQQQMAARVATALQQREHLLVEAGTGTGKTYAYLVPALLSGQRVLISTGTRTLQDQLFHRDLPQLGAALGRPVRVALLKGRSNYLCRARFADIGRQEEVLPALADPLLRRLRDWALSTRTGDLAELPELGEAHALRPQITSTRDNCLGRGCPEFDSCHVFEARRVAMEADIVVVNHHLLLADLALKEDGFGDLLPSVDAVILDEAHQLPDLANEFFGTSFSSRQVEQLLADLKPELRSYGLDVVRMAALLAPVERALADTQAHLGRTERHAAWQELSPVAHQSIGALRSALEQCAADIELVGAGPEPPAGAARTRALADAAAQVQANDEVPIGACTVSTGARGFALRLLPYDISGRFRELIAKGNAAWIFTSATLAVREDFSHFARRLGLEDAATLRLESPFDYARQALLYLPRALPEPSSARYTAAVVEVALPLINAAEGGAFLLFTSHRALRQAAELLAPQLPPEWPLLVQGSSPREQLLRRFRANGQAVLLGTASFWEGVDVQGPALRLVVIDKLPFASPDDPVVRSRIEYLTSQGEQPFRSYQLPEAVLTLKQGVGRLIRSEEDEGVVVICDPRLMNKPYGRVFRASLPPMTPTQDPAAALARLRQLAPGAHIAVSL